MPYRTAYKDGTPISNGLCFAINEDPAYKNSVTLHPIPGSLQSILTVLTLDIHTSFDASYLDTEDHVKWGIPQAKQGVLMLNTCLTVPPKGSSDLQTHKELWEPYTKQVIELIMNRREDHHVWLVFGDHGYKIIKDLGGVPDHHSLVLVPHPSPATMGQEFLNYRPFSEVNKHLSEHGQPIINW